MANSHEEYWSRRNTEGNWAVLAAVQEVAAGHGVTPGQVAIAWTFSRPGLAAAVVGARTEQQLSESLHAAELVLEETELALLNEVSRQPRRYPFPVVDG